MKVTGDEETDKNNVFNVITNYLKKHFVSYIDLLLLTEPNI